MRARERDVGTNRFTYEYSKTIFHSYAQKMENTRRQIAHEVFRKKCTYQWKQNWIIQERGVRMVLPNMVICSLGKTRVRFLNRRYINYSYCLMAISHSLNLKLYMQFLTRYHGSKNSWPATKPLLSHSFYIKSPLHH